MHGLVKVKKAEPVVAVGIVITQKANALANVEIQNQVKQNQNV